ncbi:MAG: tetraacyldisaccharide 4'-kinase [Deltaproteobacteria bacterium]|nr:tetraacyldisaccharide 4'-kinase [Deltaproteobacteria bacterium]
MIGPFAGWRRSLYGAGVFRSESLPRPVISVGNLSVGGSGKTPHVQFLASWLTELGMKVAVLSRGYGRRSKGVVWVSRGDGPAVSAEIGGDEPVLLAILLPGVPVLVGESRAEAGRECLRCREVDAFLLDDGFQHLSLRRDADLLLVEAEGGLGNRRTLPLGPLREPAESARFADALVVTKCADAAQGEKSASAVPFPSDRPRAFSRLVARATVDRHGVESPLSGGGEEVVAFSGLARNGQFLETLRASGYAVRKFFPFGDHHRYRPAELKEIASAAGGAPVLTTEKDLVRISGPLPFNLKALRIGVEFLSGWEDLSRLILETLGTAGKR